jgi:hypothetical protein
MTTLVTLAPCGISPVKAAPVIEVAWVRTKTSPVSVSLMPGAEGRDVVVIKPPGLPVPKTNESATVGNGSATTAKIIAAIPVCRDVAAVSFIPFNIGTSAN